MDYWSPKHDELLNVMNKINHQILCILLDYRYIHYLTYKKSPRCKVKGPTGSFKMHFNIINLSMSKSSKWPFSLISPQNKYAFLYFLADAGCPSHSLLFLFSWSTEKHLVRSVIRIASLCNSCSPCLPLVVPDVFLSPLLLKTLSLYSSLIEVNPLSHP